jgi:C-terminal processing protease CtpA/Prc
VGPVAPEGAELRLSRPGFATVRTAWRASDATPVRVRLTPTVAAAGDAPGAHHPGLGIRGRGGQVTVTTVVAGSAAEQAGVVAGARLVSVDGVPAADLPPDRVFALLQGPPDSNVTVELRLPTEREVRRLTLARR